MTTPAPYLKSPIVPQPRGYSGAGALCPLFYEKDLTTGLPTGLVYDEAGNLIAATPFPSGSGVIAVSSGTPGLAVPNVDFDKPGTARTLTASGNAVLADSNAILTCNHATVAIVITILAEATVAWVGRTELNLFWKGAAAVSFAAGAGVTLHAPSGQDTAEQYSIIKARRVGTNEWTLVS